MHKIGGSEYLQPKKLSETGHTADSISVTENTNEGPVRPSKVLIYELTITEITEMQSQTAVSPHGNHLPMVFIPLDF